MNKNYNPYTYSKREATGYLVGLFGQNVIYNIISTGLYFYFQNVICLPAMALGWIFTIARVWDAVNDPMMGTIVDRTRSKHGKCKPWLMYVPFVICITTIVPFLNANYATATSTGQRVAIVAWAAVSYVCWGMSYTVGDIPLWGVTSLMTQDENDRAKILGLARISAGIAGVTILIVQVAQAVGNIFESQGMEYNAAQQKGFIVTAIVMTVIASILFEFAGLSVHERVKSSEEKYGFIENFKIMFRNRPFRQIFISGVLRAPIQLLMICAMTLVTYYYCNGNFMNVITDNGIDVDMLLSLLLIGGGIFIGQFVAMGLTPKLTQKIEKKTLYNFYSVAGAVPYIMIFVFYMISGGDLRSLAWSALIGLMMFFAGAALGGINVLQSVMIADCIDYEEYTNGVRTDGVFFSGQSFITKLSAGIATIISSIAYNAVGYSGTNIDDLNTALNNGADFATYDGGSGAGKYAMIMFFLISIPPAIGMLLSAIPTWRYALTDKEHTRILGVLVEQRAAADAAKAETAEDTAEAQDDAADDSAETAADAAAETAADPEI